MRRKKILYITDCLGNGGKERQLVEILKNISKDKFSCGVVTFNRDDYYSGTVKKTTDYYRVLDKSNIFSPFFTLWSCFEEYKPVIVHTLDSLSSAYAFLPSRYNDVFFINGSVQDTGIEKGLLRAKKVFLLKNSDLILSNSYEGLKAYDVEGEVLYNVIDKSRFYPSQKKKSFDIIMVANFSDYKDYDYYLRICAELIKRGIIDNAYSAGSGKYFNKYCTYVSENEDLFKGKVKFLGKVSNIEDILTGISLGFLCSKNEYGEGISNSVLEYMAAGVIPIVTNIGASSEIINDGINGFLIGQNQEMKIAEIVAELRINNNLSERIIRSASETINMKFSVGRNINLLESLYNSCLE